MYYKTTCALWHSRLTFFCISFDPTVTDAKILHVERMFRLILSAFAVTNSNTAFFAAHTCQQPTTMQSCHQLHSYTAPATSSQVPIVIDTGASIRITPDITDFIINLDKSPASN